MFFLWKKIILWKKSFLKLSSTYIRSRDCWLQVSLEYLAKFWQFWRGHRKPLYEAPGLKSHQIWWSWCQIKENWTPNLEFVTILSIFREKCQISKGFWWVTCFNFDRVTRRFQNHHFDSQKLPNLTAQNRSLKNKQIQSL